MARRTCAICSAEILLRKPTATRCGSAECDREARRLAQQRWAAKRGRKRCERCGIEVETSTHGTRYCGPCATAATAAARQRSRDRERKAQKTPEKIARIRKNDRAYQARRRAADPAHARELRTQWYRKKRQTREGAESMRAYVNAYRARNATRLNAARRRRYWTDPEFRERLIEDRREQRRRAALRALLAEMKQMENDDADRTR